MTTTLLIDADIVAFKVASTAQKAFKFDGPDGPACLQVDDWEEVAPRLDELMAEYLATTKADDLIICLSCPTAEGWRIGIYPEYKANRDYSNRPVYLDRCKDYLAEHYRSFRKPTMEADDIMGILSTHPKLVPGKKIIVSEDKDLQTIPGWLWNPAKDAKPRFITPEQAEFFHLYQALIGDSTDGYSGCPGIGPGTAPAIIRDHIKLVPYEHVFQRGPRKGTSETRYDTATAESAWEAIVSHFEAKGLTEADALLQARVARICHASDYDFKKQEVILWTPQ